MLHEKVSRGEIHTCALCGTSIDLTVLGIGLESRRRWQGMSWEDLHAMTVWFCEPCIVKRLMGDALPVRP